MTSNLIKDPNDASGFVVLADYIPQIVQEIRYHSSYNFVGERVDGYEEPCALLTKEAARALKGAASEMNALGYRLKVFDAYRPARAVKHFMLWAIDEDGVRMKPYFYPELKKQELFDKGGPFDLFSAKSHPDCKDITGGQYENRMTLQKVMAANGFAPLDCEWWRFTLADEPYPDTYFDFPVAANSLRGN